MYELTALTTALDELAAFDDATLASAALVPALATQLARLESVVCRQVAAFDRGPLWRDAGAQTAPDWIGVECRTDRRVARRRLRVGRALAVCERAAEAFAAGAITVEHVEALSRARDHNRITAQAYARDEAMLVGWAHTETFEDFRALVDAWVLAVDTHDAERRAQRQFERRRLHLSQSFDGQWFLDGELDPVSGDAVKLMLDRITDELFAKDWAEAREALGHEPSSADLARTPAQRRADALVEMARRAGTAPAGGKAPKPLVTILAGEEAFAAMCRLSNGDVITPGAAARWLDDAVIERVVFDSPDRVLSVSHRRTYRDALRRALEVRDRRCGHRYCNRRPEVCEADHVVPYARGGPTSVQNGRLLCGFHNRLRNDRPDDG